MTACQVCGSPLIKFLELGHQPPPLAFLSQKDLGRPERTYPLTAFFCQNCTLVQQGYTVDPWEMFGGQQFYTSGSTVSFVKHLEELAEMMMARYKPKFVVDIGCSDGTLLKFFRDNGAKVLGVEPSSTANLARKAGVPILKTFFGRELAIGIAEKYGKPDLVTATNVFAHFAGVGDFMSGLERLIKDSGIFLSESQYILDVLKKNAYDTFYHEHQRCYSVKSISEFLNRYGFSVEDAERVEGVGGSIRVMAVKGKATYSSRAAGLLRDEKRAGLTKLSTYTRFAERVKKQRENLNALLWRLKAEGNRLAAVGAAGRATTLACYCGIGLGLVDYVTEVSPLKVGYYTPGMHIPVVEEKRLFEDQPNYAVMFSWHLADKIMPKLRAAGYNGKFIVPLPGVKIVD